jgi:hypothetical protein
MDLLIIVSKKALGAIANKADVPPLEFTIL